VAIISKSMIRRAMRKSSRAARAISITVFLIFVLLYFLKGSGLPGSDAAESILGLAVLNINSAADKAGGVVAEATSSLPISDSGVENDTGTGSNPEAYKVQDPSQSQSSQKIIIEDSALPLIALFCPEGHCAENLEHMINASEKVHCALFDVNVEGIVKALKRKNALLVVDDSSYEPAISFARKDTAAQLSHNKFCVFDDKIVWTGSFNPTAGGSARNDNNVLIMFSEAAARNYEAEFQELWNGQYSSGAQTEHPVLSLNGTQVETYFCPEDWCANRVLKALSMANSSIEFMIYSFTHDSIADMLLKKHAEGLAVRGVMEKQQNSKYSVFPKLNVSGMEVYWDKNPLLMHHKVFIIDNRIVVTGSFNPSSNADTRNDENLVIVDDQRIALAFENEFARVFPGR